LAYLVLALDHLGRERAFADARRVGADYAEDAAYALRREPEPGGDAARGRARRCDERVRAVVNVEQRGLRALDEDAAALAHGGVEVCGGVCDEGLKALDERRYLVEDLPGV
jgi:hypothetical protein